MNERWAATVLSSVGHVRKKGGARMETRKEGKQKGRRNARRADKCGESWGGEKLLLCSHHT